MDLQEGEVALPIEGFPEYFITNRGRVWSNMSNRWLTPSPWRRYYYGIIMRKEGKTYARNIHRLVGTHFLPEYKEGLWILHKDETLPYPDIHFVENLWVGTSQQNVIDRDRKGRGLKGRKRAPFTEEHKRNMSEAQKGKKLSAEHKKKLKEAWTKRRKM